MDNKNQLISIPEIPLMKRVEPERAVSLPSNKQWSGDKMKVYYISDIHLLHHIKTKHEADINRRVKDIVKGLFTADLINNIEEEARSYFTLLKLGETKRFSCCMHMVVFGGDISSDTALTKMFYKEFKKQYAYYYYCVWRDYFGAEWPRDDIKEYYEWRKADLNTRYKKEIEAIKPWYKYSAKSKSLWVNQICKRAKSNGCPSWFVCRLRELKRIEKELADLEAETVGWQDFYWKLQGVPFQLPKMFPVFTVLGNHELQDYATVREAVADYKEFLEQNRICLLHNSAQQIKGVLAFADTNRDARINELAEVYVVGGIGFAKYNKKHNAKTLITTTPAMTREEEIEESELFAEAHKHAIEYCQKNSLRMITVSHYPTCDWLEGRKTSPICTYFTGHTHNNKDTMHDCNVDIYADNQIGYKKKEIELRQCTLGTILNPFHEYKEGYYKIDTKLYMQFLRFSNESVSGLSHIENQVKSKDAQLYMIKKAGFYGFFVINQKTGTKICAGGRIKTVSKETNIEYFYDAFAVIVKQYFDLLAPFRGLQEKISKELKRMGFAGTIHGCIIDVVSTYHIMVNPVNWELAFYESPLYGSVHQYNSFANMLDDIKRTELLLGSNGEEYIKLIDFAYEELLKENSVISALDKGRSLLPVIETTEEEWYIKVNRKTSVYAVSTRLQQLQRLFTNRILREWNEEWAQEYRIGDKTAVEGGALTP